MLTYWLMFLLPALAALMMETQRTGTLPVDEAETPVGAWIAVGIVLTLLIGFRYEVGGDWFNYVFILDNVAGLMLDEVFLLSDPGYQLLNWLSLELDWDIFGVNLMAGAIFAIGLVVFCRNLPRPWLALAVAVPYLVIEPGGLSSGFFWRRRFTRRPCCCCRWRHLPRRKIASSRWPGERDRWPWAIGCSSKIP
jgi:hypothetical protein